MNTVLYLVIPCYNEDEVLHETARQLKVKERFQIKVELCLLMMVLKIKLGVS